MKSDVEVRFINLPATGALKLLDDARPGAVMAAGTVDEDVEAGSGFSTKGISSGVRSEAERREEVGKRRFSDAEEVCLRAGRGRVESRGDEDGETPSSSSSVVSSVE